MEGPSIQERQFPSGECFGCGSGNPLGLRLESFPSADGAVVARWTPKPEHSNGGGSLCGGDIATAVGPARSLIPWTAQRGMR